MRLNLNLPGVALMDARWRTRGGLHFCKSLSAANRFGVPYELCFRFFRITVAPCAKTGHTKSQKITFDLLKADG